MDLNKYDYIIDVRTKDEWEKGHHRKAINIPVMSLYSCNCSKSKKKERNEYDSLLADIPKDSKILVHCHSGVRAKMAIKRLRKRGYTNLTLFNKTYDKL